MWDSYFAKVENSQVINMKSLYKDFFLSSKGATWMSTSLLSQKAYRFTNVNTYVFSDSMPCVGKMKDDPIATWKSKIKWYSENNHFKDMNRIDGMPTEFEWKIFPGITALGFT